MRFPTPGEISDEDLKLTDPEVRDGLQIILWDQGYVKYKVFGDYVEMRSIYVVGKYREQGWGIKLMKELEKITIAKGQKYILVHANTDGKNDVLGRFLTKLKYKLIGEYLWRKNI